MNAVFQLMSDVAQPRDSCVRGLRYRPLYIEMKDRFGCTCSQFGHAPPAGIARAGIRPVSGVVVVRIAAQIALLLATIQFDTQAVAAADSPKDLTAAASSSLTSKTVSSFPSCITARTVFVGLSTFNSPRRFRTLVKEPIR
jgi:hypothetical protein